MIGVKFLRIWPSIREVMPIWSLGGLYGRGIPRNTPPELCGYSIEYVWRGGRVVWPHPTAYMVYLLWTYITSRVLVHPCSDFTRINFGYVSVELSLRSGWSALYFPSERGGNSRVLIRIWPEISRFSDDRCGSQLALFLVPGMFLVWILVNKVIVNIFSSCRSPRMHFWSEFGQNHHHLRSTIQDPCGTEYQILWSNWMRLFVEWQVDTFLIRLGSIPG